MNFKAQLDDNERIVLENTYGRQTFSGINYNPNELEDVLDLTPNEKKFFAKNFISPHFFVQALYKINLNISPIKFNSFVRNFIRENKNLRVNFCNLGSRTVKVIKPDIFFKIEIVFRNLMSVDKDSLNDLFRNILEADMRRDCDIRNDSLIRFAVFKTDSSECAILITFSQLISEYFNPDKFFCDFLGITYDSKQKSIKDDLPIKNSEEIRDYWSKMLVNPPRASELPYEKNFLGSYRQKSYHSTISADILSDLRFHAQSNRMMLTAILQSAWGFAIAFSAKFYRLVKIFR